MQALMHSRAQSRVIELFCPYEWPWLHYRLAPSANVQTCSYGAIFISINFIFSLKVHIIDGLIFAPEDQDGQLPSTSTSTQPLVYQHLKAKRRHPNLQQIGIYERTKCTVYIYLMFIAVLLGVYVYIDLLFFSSLYFD